MIDPNFDRLLTPQKIFVEITFAKIDDGFALIFERILRRLLHFMFRQRFIVYKHRKVFIR